MILEGGDTAQYCPGVQDWRGVKHHGKREKGNLKEGSEKMVGSSDCNHGDGCPFSRCKRKCRLDRTEKERVDQKRADGVNEE